MSDGDSRGVALVSGANRGIGKEVARQLAELCYEVLLSARDGAKASAAALELQREHRGNGAGADARRGRSAAASRRPRRR